MKVLLTGASGFIGKFLFEKEPSLFRCVIRNEQPDSSSEHYQIRELSNKTNWIGAFDGCDSVIHLAGLAHSKCSTIEDFRVVNTEGTLHLAMEAAKAGVRRFVFVSSIGVNGVSTYCMPFSSSSVANPHNDYSRSKYEAEVGLKDIAKNTGLEVVIVRPTLVYGANAPGNFKLLVNLVSKLPILFFALTDNKRDFISVQNLADLLITCAKHPNAVGHTFLASDMDTVSIKEFTNAIADGLDKKLLQLPIPISLMRFAGKLTGKSVMVEQLVGNLQVDSSNIKEVLGWTPPLTMKQAMSTIRNSGK